ncbi:hypothetical protein EQM14_01430 [Caproiciproducens sp. NJN-50]|uniref:hypothetical protein n=1 Tax=Caproiciproducens sp. NJN-50 TaxID=2507162 RepID=UPI000FFE0179|nr:hypothetical protein [Caproiciproducens sp. NJN-50]QAT48546.1 hypothetical protein EQM14_01430 [Caproiciproducens sp. NJN-50]
MTIKEEEYALRYLLNHAGGIENPDDKSLYELLTDALGPDVKDLMFALKNDGLIKFGWFSDGPHNIRITPDGLMYFDVKKRRNKELWIKNAWIPILVSVATNLAINGLKWLWPLIQEWVSSFH